MPWLVEDFKERQIDHEAARTILFKGPEEAPIFAALNALGRVGDAKSPEVSWYDEDLPAYRTQINGGSFDSTSTTITVDDGSVFNELPAILYAEATGEQMLVTARSGNNLTLVRGLGATSAANGSVADNAFVRFLSQAAGEGSGAPTANKRTNNEYKNLCQHFKISADQSGKSQRTSTVIDDYRAHQRMMKMKAQTRQFEQQILFGVQSKDLNDAAGNRVWTMDGLNTVITSTVDNVAGTMTKARFNTFARNAFRNHQGAGVLVLAASPLLNETIHTLAENKLQTRTSETLFGLRISRVVTPHGDFDLLPTWALRDGFDGWGFAIDPSKVMLRFMDGMKPHIKNDVQLPDTDGYKDLIQAEFTLDYGSESYHSIIKGVTGPA